MFVWSGIVFALFVLKGVVEGSDMTAWEWAFLPFFLIALTFVMYGMSLFQIELGKSVWRFFRRSPPET